MKLNKNFNQFEENIKLTPLQKDDVRKKYNSVCEKIHNHFYPEGNTYTGQTKYLVGSYGKHTHIRPARDIDVIFILPYELYKNYQSLQGNAPSQLLQKVREILIEKYPNTKISANEKVVVVSFVDPAHDVEIIPAFYDENRGIFIIPNSTNNGSWEEMDYKSKINQLENLNKKTNGNVKKTIRFIKKWTDNISLIIKSYEIEEYVINFFNLYENQKNENMSFLICDFFKYFFVYTNNKKNKSAIETAFKRATNACNFESNEKWDEAIDEWRKIFGEDFPKTLLNSNSSEDLEKEIKNPPEPWISN